MSGPVQQLTQNGQEIQQSDWNNLGFTAGHADDAVISEFLRVAPFGWGGVNVVNKAIFPSFESGNLASGGSNGVLNLVSIYTVQPGAAASGTVKINPFRAVIGSRIAAGTNATQNWSDIRSNIWIGSATSLSSQLSITANSSGSTRWDLVYATVAIDTNATSVTRFVKNPSTKQVNATSVVTQLVTTISTSIAIGSSTTGPSNNTGYSLLPADTASNFYIPLALIRVVNGFGATSSLANTDIVDIAPIAMPAASTGTMGIRPANQSYLPGGTVLSGNFAYQPTAGTRSSVFLPAGMAGGESLFVAVDTSGTAANWSHINNQVIDSSRDWRNRCFFVVCAASVPGAFAWDLTNIVAGVETSFRVSPGVNSFLNSGASNGSTVFCTGQSFAAEPASLLPATFGGVGQNGTVFLATPTQIPGMLGGASGFAGIYVKTSDGSLRWSAYTTTSPTLEFFFWIFATGQFPNF